jgi:hypothetical protein
MFRAGFFPLKSRYYFFIPYLGWVTSILGMGYFHTWDGLLPYLGWVTSILGMGYFHTWDGLLPYKILVCMYKISSECYSESKIKN